MEEKSLYDQVLQALSTVQEPELHQDLVTLNMIQNLGVVNGNVTFDIVLTTPACPLKDMIETQAKKAVAAVEGVKTIQVKMTAKVKADGRDRESVKLNVKNAIAVASGKGGVGKTTVAVNLAVELAKMGARVGLLDADIYGPNVPTMMGVDRLPPSPKDKIMPAEAYGVKIMSIGFLVPPGKALIWRGPMLHSAIRQFLGDVAWGDLDYFIIDLPPGTGDVQLSLAQTIPLTGSVIVTLPQAVSVEDADRGIQMFQELNIPVLGVVENMSYLELPDGSRMDVFGQGGGEKLAIKRKIPFLGAIPMDSQVRVGGDQGAPVAISHPESASGKIFLDISQRLAAELSMAAYRNQPK